MRSRFAPFLKHRPGLATVIAVGLALAVAAPFPHRGPAPSQFLSAAERDEGSEHYFTLHKLYIKWSEGLFGSRRFHERKLRQFLISLIGREITTDYDYLLASPEGLYDAALECRFQESRWLIIHGDLDEESRRQIAALGYEALKGWWRSGILVAVTAKVKNFKLDWDRFGDTVHLYCDRIRLIRDERGK